MRVAVLGAGITGIAIARELVARGYDPQVLEAAPWVGGLCRSETDRGFVHDLAGGHILHSRDTDLLGRMVAELGAGEAVENLRNTKIFYRGRYVKYPFENGLGDLPAEDNFQAIKGYIEAWERRRHGAGEPGNFRDWIAWRMGDGIARQFMYPYNEKLWCSDLSDVSTSWVSGRVPEAPLEDVLRSSLGISTEGYTHQIKFYYPRRGGFGTLVERMAEPIAGRIRLSTPVEEVVAGSGHFTVNGEDFDRVVNTIPLPELYARLKPAPPADVLAAVRGLRYLSLATVLIAVDRPALAPHSWIYLPHPEDGPSNRITYLMNYSPENAPPGQSSILAEVTFPGETGPRHGEAVEKEVVAGLERAGLVRAADVLFTRSASFRYAYPYYDLGFAGRMARVEAHLASLGLPSLGRFGGFKYVNTDHVLMLVRDFFQTDFPPLG